MERLELVSQKSIALIKEGLEQGRGHQCIATSLKAGVLTDAIDWVVGDDIGSRLVLPRDIFETTFRTLGRGRVDNSELDLLLCYYVLD